MEGATWGQPCVSKTSKEGPQSDGRLQGKSKSEGEEGRREKQDVADAFPDYSSQGG